MIRTAIASFGMSGKVFHAPLIDANPNMSVYKILERNRSESKHAYPESQLVRDYNDILNDDQVDVVIVNTPNPYHYEMGKQALEAGKHVVMEKPFTNTSEEGQGLIEIANKNNLLLTVFQNRRFDSDFLTVKKIIDQNLLGYLVEYEAHYDRYRNFIQEDTWKEEDGPGSGILYNLGSHMIDQALVLFDLPKSVSCRLAVQRKGGKAPDSYHIILDYDEFAVVLKSSYLVRDEGPRYKVLGNIGTFTKYGLDVQEDCLKAGQNPKSENWGLEPPEMWGTLDTDLNGLHFVGEVASVSGDYNYFYTNFVDAIQNGAPLAVKANEALNVIKIIEAAIQSHEEGRLIQIQ